MKLKRRVLITCLLTSTAVLVGIIGSTRSVVAQSDAATSPVVVELFTSEGCSSCPPADALLMNLVAQDTIVLSFHVDYWNRLGWQDPFSSSQYTARQNGYARIFGEDQVYTPQMIVSGETQFVGSNKSKAATAIATARKENRDAQNLTLHASEADSSKSIRVDYQLASGAQGKSLQLAIVQKSAVSRVTAGENSNRTLPHVNVVRAFKSIPLTNEAQGQIELELPADLTAANAHVVGYVQDPQTGKIGIAAEIEIH